MKFSPEKGKYFEYIFSLKQKQMKNVALAELRKFYPEENICEKKEYLYAIGNIPIALVAHLDTVWEDNPPKYTFFDPFKNVMWSPNGLGADDRAGVIAIFEIIRTGLRPHIIFTTDEEIGALGAEELASIQCPFKDLRYMIELDRRGRNDCVFYDCESKPFQNYINTFGFETAIGSFSDISMLCGAWQVCGVNLSIGYYNEHTQRELLFLTTMYNTITRVIKMLKEKNIPHFVWEGTTYIPQFTWIDYMNYAHSNFKYACKSCHKPLSYNEACHARTSGGGTAYYCIECMPQHVAYCERCGAPYECDEGISYLGFCNECGGKVAYEAFGNYFN